MSDDETGAYLKLLSLFEGGSEHWFGEYGQHGALALIERIEGGAYAGYKKIGEKLADTSSAINVVEKLSELTDANAFLLTRADSDWPAGVDALTNPPIALIGRGVRAALAQMETCLSIVGTRNPTQYGSRIAGDFAAGLVDRGWTIVSGGAMGIDSAAHKGALVAEGSTIAVLANGVGVSFPPSNHRLFSEILESGLLISEVLPKVHAIPARFLIRNRLIAAMSKATLVVEAAFRSGSLRTAREAASLMRPVFAIPGPITSPTSDGCHRLIGERCAELVTSVADLAELVSPLTLL